MATYEQQEDVLPKKPVLLVLLGVLLVIAGSVIWVVVAMGVWIGDRRPEGWEERPEPQPQEIFGVEMRLYDERGMGLTDMMEQRERITSFGWVNREEELVRIPIDDAMQLYLDQRQQEAP